MKITVLHADIAEATADAIVVPTDGVVPDHFGPSCRAVLRASPIEKVPTGFGNGNISSVPAAAGSPWNRLIFVGTISDTRQEGYATTALASAIQHAVQRGYRTLATPMLTGGWRIRLVDATWLMLNVADRFATADLELIIVEHDEEKAAEIRGVVESAGW